MRRAVFGFLALFPLLLALPPPCHAQPLGAGSEPSPAEWARIRSTAERFVDQESPPGVLPFVNPSAAALASAPRTTFAHYFPPYPLALGNVPAGNDAYNRVLLNPDGGHGQFRRIGGYLRDRPLPVGPWPSPHWRQINYAIEILRAERIGLDAFECDLLRVAPEGPFNAWTQINMLMQTAAAVAPGFRIVIQPDSAALRAVPAPRMAEAIATLARYPSAYRLPDGRLLVAPFAPENMGPQYWRRVLSDLRQRGIRAAFIPILLAWRREAPAFAPLSYAMSAWGERDVDAIEGRGFQGFFTAMAPSTSLAMMPVAPQDVRPKVQKFWETRNTDAFRLLWGQAIQHGARFVHIVTWNDYSESSGVSPSAGTQFVFYDLAAYFNDWYKTDQPPPIVHDAIYYSERTQIIPPRPSEYATMEPIGPTPVANRIQMLAFLTAPATLQITLGGHVWRQPEPAGLAAFSIPAEPGRPAFAILRGGAAVVQVTSGWEIHRDFRVENPAYFGGSSNRPFIAVPPRVGNPNG
jgi:Glycosyl hydrolase family 71